MMKSSKKKKIGLFGIILELENLILAAFLQFDFFLAFHFQKIEKENIEEKIELQKRCQN